jgi:hypothetical protein
MRIDTDNINASPVAYGVQRVEWTERVGRKVFQHYDSARDYRSSRFGGPMAVKYPGPSRSPTSRHYWKKMKNVRHDHDVNIKDYRLILQRKKHR